MLVFGGCNAIYFLSAGIPSWVPHVHTARYFGSLSSSILTLYSSMSGGEDWTVHLGESREHPVGERFFVWRLLDIYILYNIQHREKKKYIYTSIYYVYIYICCVYDIFSVGVIQIEVGTSDHFDFDVCIFSDERWERTREVGCIEVLPCVKSSRLAISVSWLSGGIPRKKTTWHSAIWLPSRFQTPWTIPYTSLLLHDFYAKKPAVSYHSLDRSGSFYRFKSDMEAMALWLRYCIYHYIMNALMV